MNRILQFFVFFTIQIFLFILIFILWDLRIIPVLETPVVWILSAVFSLLGFFVGRAVYEVKLKPVARKNKIIRGGYIFGTICFVALFVFLVASKEKPEPYTNSVKNRDVMKYFVDKHEEYVRIAFTRLESEFNSPDDFELKTFSIRKQDTVYLGRRDTVFNIYFTYYLATDSTVNRVSKISVFDGVADLQFYNLDTKKSEEYLQVQTQNRQSEKEALQSIKESLEQLPDSIRESLTDTIRHLLNK